MREKGEARIPGSLRYHFNGGREGAGLCPSALQIHRALMEGPITTAGWLVKKTGITAATVNKALTHLERLGIVRELTSRKRNRLFRYTGYVEIMNQGTEPLV